MQFLKTSCAVFFAALLAGCSSLNFFSADNPNRKKPNELTEFPATASVKKLWSASVGKGNGLHFQPAVLNDSIVTAAADGTLTRIGLKNGTTAWRIKAGMPLTSGTGTDGTTIVVAGAKGAVLAFTDAGTLKWKAQAPSEVLSAPAVGQGMVVVRSIDNQMVAFDAATGDRKWIVQRPLPPLTLRAAPGITISDESVYVALPGGRLSALSLLNGGPRWEVAVGNPRGTTELERIADVSGSPVIFGDSVCAVAFQGRIGCFNVSTGAPQWLKNFSSDTGLSVDDRQIYSSDENGHLVAMSRDAGEKVWANEKLAHRNLSASSTNGNFVAVGDGFGYVHFLSPTDGSFVARTATDGSPIRVAPTLAESVVVVQTQAGTVSAFAVGKP
jgi:outer membrane protein assembly factor BamB